VGLLTASTLLQELFAGKNVLEIACGTSYWTEVMGRMAASVLATDVNERVIALAKTRPLGNQVRFAVADMYRLAPEQPFDGLFGGFIWSHIPRQDLDSFLLWLKRFVRSQRTIGFIDSHPVEGTSQDPERIALTSTAKPFSSKRWKTEPSTKC